MTVPQISPRGEQYLKTARTLLRTVETMTDGTVVSPTTTGGAPRKLRTLMRPKHPLDRLPALKATGLHHLMGSFTAQPAEEMPSDAGGPACVRFHEIFIPTLPLAELQSWR